MGGPADGEASLGIVQVEAKAGDTYHLPPPPQTKNKAGRILEIIPGVLISPMWVVTAGIS